MSKKRRTFSAEYKAKVGLEALKEAEPIHVIASKHQVHPVQVTAGDSDRTLFAELFRQFDRAGKTALDLIRIPSRFTEAITLLLEKLGHAYQCHGDVVVDDRGAQPVEALSRRKRAPPEREQQLRALRARTPVTSPGFSGGQWLYGNWYNFSTRPAPRRA